jgi:hypothetical protein
MADAQNRCGDGGYTPDKRHNKTRKNPLAQKTSQKTDNHGGGDNTPDAHTEKGINPNEAPERL